MLIYLAIIGVVATLLRFWGGEGEGESSSVFVDRADSTAPPRSMSEAETVDAGAADARELEEE